MRPYYAKRGWRDRYRPLIEGVQIVGLAAFLLILMAVLTIYVLTLP